MQISRNRIAAAVFLLALIASSITVNVYFQFARPVAAYIYPGAIFLSVLYLLALSLLFGGRTFTLTWLAVLVTIFAVIEVGTRLWLENVATPEQRERFIPTLTGTAPWHASSINEPHHYTLYNPRPSLHLPIGLYHNHLGMRDHRPLTHKEKVIRIVVIGGTAVYSPALGDNRETFTARLEGKLNQHYQDQLDGTHIQVVNAGMVGATSAESLLRLIFFVSEVEPDLVVIHHGISDLWPRSIGRMQSDYGNYVAPWDTTRFREPHRPLASALALKIAEQSVLLTALARHLGVPSIDIIQATRNIRASVQNLRRNDTRYFERNTRFMIAISRSLGAKVLLVDNIVLESWTGSYRIAVPEHNAVLKRLAAEEGTYFYEFSREPLDHPEAAEIGKQLNREESELKAELFFEELVRTGLIPMLYAERTDDAVD